MAATGSVATVGGSPLTAVTAAAGGANCTATTGVAADSADSIWQQEAAAVMAVAADVSGPWQQPPEDPGSPRITGPWWQKQSPAAAFNNAKANAAIPRGRSRGFMRCVLE